MTIEWEDVSSYSYQDRLRDKEPSSWELKVPYHEGHRPLSIKIHRRRDYGPDVWLLSCYSIMLGPRKLKATDVDEAKKEAVQYIHELIKAMDTAIGEVAHG